MSDNDKEVPSRVLRSATTSNDSGVTAQSGNKCQSREEADNSAGLLSISMPDLQSLISQIVLNVMQKQNSDVVQNRPSTSAQANMENLTLPISQENCADLNTIPDIIKDLREFSGKKHEFSSWKRSVLELYRPIINTPKYTVILNSIRNKITGDADLQLDANNIELNWEKISNHLSLYYNDKRDIATIESQMLSLSQGNRSSIQFFENINHELSLIIEKISNMELPVGAEMVLKDSYKQKALNTFIKGLRGDLPKFLIIKDPKSMTDALEFCIKIENQTATATQSNRFESSRSYSHHRNFNTNNYRSQANSQTHRGTFRQRYNNSPLPVRQEESRQSNPRHGEFRNQNNANNISRMHPRFSNNFHINSPNQVNEFRPRPNQLEGSVAVNQTECTEQSDIHFLD